MQTVDSSIQNQPALPKSYWASEQDAIAYTRRCLICAVILFAAYGFSAVGILPLLCLVIVSALVLPRWLINMHELLHLRNEQQVHPFIRLMGASPLPLTPVSLSYGQFRALHAAHHAAPATENDPDAYHIRGSWIGSLVNAFTTPEQAGFRWLKAHGSTRQLAVDMAIKFALFIGLVGLGGSTFLWFWLSLRVVYGLSDFAFFRIVHYRGGDYGTFCLPLPSGAIAVGELLFGKTVIQAAIHHDVHHCNPRVAAHALSSARDCLETV